MCDERPMEPDHWGCDWAPRQALTWNRMVEEGPGPDWLSCPLWLLAICPFWCEGSPPSCDGTRDR